MKYRLVLFDFDGVIYDQQPVSELGKDVTFSDLENHYNQGISLDHLVDQFRPYWTPYDGLMEFIAELSMKKGVITNGPTILQRSKIEHVGLDKLVNPELIFVSYEEAEKIVDTPNHAYLSELDHTLSRFEKVKYIENNHTGKPNPYMIIEACLQAGCAPEETIMIGDQHTDITAAKEAGTHAAKVEGLTPLSMQNAGSQLYTAEFVFHKENIVSSLQDILS